MIMAETKDLVTWRALNAAMHDIMTEFPESFTLQNEEMYM